MNNKILRNLIMTIILATIGILVFIVGLINDQIPFGIAGLGFALVGITIEVYLKNKNDIVTKNGEKRSEIERYDERNIMINAKSGKTVNILMDICTFIIAGLSVYLNISLIGQILIFSLLLVRIIIRPVIKGYYETQL